MKAAGGTCCPLVSIIIPTYNRRQLLAEAMASCLSQSYPNIEVIVVDDGSTDGTDAFVAAASRGLPAGRIRYYQQRNGGASEARNRGLERAKGEFVQFLDSDDLLFKEKLRLQVAELARAPSHYDGNTCYGIMGQSPLGPTRRIGVKRSTPFEYIRTLCSGVVHGMQTSAPLWRRSFLAGQEGWRTDISLGDDWEYHIRLLSNARNIGFVEEDLFLVREHEGARLSDARRNHSRIMSSIEAHQAVVETLRRSEAWDEEVLAGILRTARTLYANMLDFGTSEELVDFEKWVWGLSKESRRASLLPSLILCRRIFGRHPIRLSHRLLLRLRSETSKKAFHQQRGNVIL